MRQLARLKRSIDFVVARNSAHAPLAFFCLACRHKATPFSTSIARPAQSTKVPFTEKIRRKIWGTDQPPGQEDPYGDASVFDLTKDKRQEKRRKGQEEREERQKSAERAQPDMSTYEAATTWDGIPRVGGFGHWWKDNWDPEHQYSGFVPEKTLSDPYQITAALHRALVEVYVCKQARLPLTNHTPATAQNSADEIQICHTANGVELQFPQGVTFDAFARSLKSSVDEIAEHEAPAEFEADVAADRSTSDLLQIESEEPLLEEASIKVKPTESRESVAEDRSFDDPSYKASRSMTYEKVVRSWDPSWRQISMENPEIKFAVLRRVLQLTGIRIPDSFIQPSKTAGAILSHIVKPPKPRKLAQALSQQQRLLSLRNVKIYGKRITPIEKETRVGRWKLIKQELKDRGLPVTGLE